MRFCPWRAAYFTCLTIPQQKNQAWHHRNAGGFSLVEMGAVLLVIGVILFATIVLILPMVQAMRHIETVEKMSKVSRVINRYAVTHYRLPCPAEPNRAAVNPPYGFETGSGATGTAVPDICPVTEGIIPYNALGVPEDLVIDGYGNHFTYAISPAFSQNTVNDLPATVHPACRTADWFFDEGKDGGVRLLRPLNPDKARFCCPGTPAQTTDLDILDENSNFVLAMTRDPGPDGYQPPETLMRPVDANGVLLNSLGPEYFLAPQVPPAAARSTAPAYIIISHGQNGLGAFVPGANARNPTPTTTQEAENADGDNDYFDTKTRSTSVTTRFDDLVLWRTQDMIFAEEGESCSLP